MDQISTQDCMDVMQELGDMDLMDSSTADDDVMWDPSVLFPDDQDLLHLDHHDGTERFEDDHDDDDDDQATRVSSSEEDLAMVFFEWLKSNKESISAEDLRSIKLKRSTIECAARRLGGGKEGMKQLLKLILEWVQNHQLQKKRMAAEHPPRDQHHHHQMMMMNNTTTSTTSLQDSSYNFQSNNLIMSPHDHDHDHDHHQAMMSSGNPYFAPPPPPWMVYAAAYGNQYAAGAAGAPMCNQHQSMFQGHGHDNRLVRLGPSATKEARKKRMARQKRFFSHHHNRSSNGHGNNQNQTTPSPPPTATASMEQQQRHSRLASDANCTSTTSVGHANRGNWMFWSSSSGGAPPVMLPDAVAPPTASSVDRGGIGTAVGSMQAHHQQYQQQIGLDRRQGCSTTNIKSGSEKNLKFLLQKVLKQSDVGNLGRIVLPKKEAETYLPELEARDGISIAMEDIGTSRTWNMRYRFLFPPLAGKFSDFVRSNGLQEGDFIVIYSDVKCGKYMIRGVKVRQPGSSKMEARKQGKLQRSTLHGTTSSRTAAAASPFVKEMVT
ncbi:hypothetical protein Scep_029303 [Stephania cephalantha]|uniref:TF-B3 domain-containing protein n=1 Tax=Stephania cephalantha TaxID=152367 RepID=A0AAP0E1W0_9MAGN